MADEKKTQEQDEVSDENLKNVAGGVHDVSAPMKKKGPLQNESMDREGTIET